MAPHSTQRALSMAAVVCCFTTERWDDIVRAVGSLLSQELRVDDVIIVVDHNDELLARCRDRWKRGVTIIPNAGRPGLSDGRNTGLHAATSDVVAFLDDDAAAAPDWSARLLRAYADEVIGVGGHIEPVWPEGSPPSWWPPAFNWVVGCSYEGMPTRVAPVRNVIGANMSVRRDVALRAGGFNPTMGRVGRTPIGGEETDLYIRAARSHPGSVILYEPAARVDHRVTAQRATWRYFVARCFGEGLTKATLSRITGSATAVSAEVSYTTRTLPRAFVRGVLSSDPRRGGAVAIGLATTIVGYLRGWLAAAWRRLHTPAQ